MVVLGQPDEEMADPANSPLGRMLLDEISPVVMVLRTDLVEEACHKNNLSLVEMLKPFCAFNNIDGNSLSFSLLHQDSNYPLFVFSNSSKRSAFASKPTINFILQRQIYI